MKLGIIVAMQKELDLLLEILGEYSVAESHGYKFFEGAVGDTSVVAMTCGIGKVNAAVGTTVLIDQHAPDAVINSGVGGGTGHGASILDVVIAKHIGYHDVWCGPGTMWGEAAGCPRLFDCPVDADALSKELGVKCGMVASGDIFVSREQDVQRILALYPEAMVVDMESAAIAQVCHMRGVPMYCIRVVSDTPGAADNISQYENFWTDAPRHTFSTVRRLIEILAEA